MKGVKNAYPENLGWMITNDDDDSSKYNKFVWNNHQIHAVEKHWIWVMLDNRDFKQPEM